MATNVYKVTWHYKSSSGNKNVVSEPMQDFISAAAGDENTLRAVLVSNSKVRNGATIEFTSITNANSLPQGVLT